MNKILSPMILSILLSMECSAQCNADSLSLECIKQLKSFYLIKNFNVNNKNGSASKAEYSYVFTKGTQYQITLCSRTPFDKMDVTVYDYERRKTVSLPLGDSPSFSFECQTTGIYYVEYAVKSSQKFCGVSSLGFRRMHSISN